MREDYAIHWIAFWNDLLRNDEGVTYYSETAGRKSITDWLLAALLSLPLAQYPPITPPSVQVSISYPGASAQVVATRLSYPAGSPRPSSSARAAPEWPIPGMPFHMSATMLTIDMTSGVTVSCSA